MLFNPKLKRQDSSYTKRNTDSEDKKIIKELQKIECEDEIIIAGELYALNENSQRERSSDVRHHSPKKMDKFILQLLI